jgi:hypothetical protein
MTPAPLHAKPDPYAPKTSWWLDAQTREAFSEAAKREQLRMSLSRAARLSMGVTVGWGAAKAKLRGPARMD